MTETARDYRSTLNLPKTAFPMKANLGQAEPATLKRWAESSIAARVLEARADAPNFVFHDGPPYANGNIHIGHLLNKVLKDFVVRTRLMEGHRVHYVPGWDCHGLPIEHKVMTELVEKGKTAKLDTLEPDLRRMAIRRECGASADKFIKLQCGQMERLLTLADYAHPYATKQPEYEAATLEVFAAMVEQGVVYRDLKPVHWSIANQTALAEAELEYEDRDDPSVYVDFESSDAEAVGKAFGVEPDCRPSFMIWTTTPWTLPANLAIAVHPKYRYSLIEHDGALSVVASDLWPKVAAAVGAEKHRVIAECDGAALVGLTYRHPFCDRESPIVAADYVTLEDGTGLVHTAPGHGADDYRTGLREGLSIYCPVRGDGTYDDTVPQWLQGVSVWDANRKVVEHLTQSGHMVHHQLFRHSYPHDWRSKTPVIFRATEQWFVGVDRPVKSSGKTLREMALAAVDGAAAPVKFVPEWGRNRMRGMLENRPDWCLSRQRSWGLPIPAFMQADGTVFMTPASVRAVAKRVAEKGSDCWFQESPAQLLAGYDAAKDANAPAGFDIATLTKAYDIFDVWFEAGSSWNSVLRARGIGFPSELYLEGSDQHRGWFQLSLLPALAVTGEPPYRALLTHGFIVDKDGKKMSKSLGNAIEVEELLKQHGAEVARWWVCSVPYDGDIRVDMEFFRLAGESYRKVRNTLRFLLSNLSDFNPEAWKKTGATIDPETIDGWAMAELDQLQRTVRDAYERYQFRDAHVAIFDFCNETLSARYCAATKDRLYCDSANSPRRRRTQATMWACVETLCKLLAPVLPHTAEEAWGALWQSVGVDAAKSRPLVMERYGAAAGADAEAAPAARHPAWDAAMVAKESVSKALEVAKADGLDNPLDAGVSIVDRAGTLKPVAADLPDFFGVSRVELVEAGAGAGSAAAGGGATVAVIDLRNEPRCERSWRRDGTVSARGDGGLLSDRDAAAVGV